MKVAGLQFDIAWENRAANYGRVRGYAKSALDHGADLLVLPEMFATGFSMDLGVTAEPNGGETTAFIKSLASEFGLAVVGGMVLKTGSGFGRNVAMSVDREGRELAVYAKSHLVSLLDEDKFHEHGDGPKPFDLGGVRCACLICYDLRFPELFRLAADRCDLIIVIASWPRERQRHWDLLLQARAIENQQYVVGVNRVGEGGGLLFEGGSAIYDPMGERLDCGGSKEGLVLAEIDPARVIEARNQLPFLKDRRF